MTTQVVKEEDGSKPLPKPAHVEKKERTGEIPQPCMELGNEVVKGPKSALRDLSFVRTGELRTMTEKQLTDWLNYHGGRLDKAVTGNTNYLLVAAEPGDTKLAAAKAKKVPMISEAELFDLVLEKGGQWVHNDRSVSGWK